MKSKVQSHEQRIHKFTTANLANIQSLIQQKLAPLNLQIDTLKQDNIRLNEEINALKLVNQSTFATLVEQANCISENSKKISFQKHTFQQLEEYVFSTIPSLDSTMEGDLQNLDTQLNELKNTNVNLRGKVNNLRILIDQDMATLKK